uniref:Uncharacterized protein n=1 Tax=Rhizophora mucronata TaxID=61149 RepID=A0A2P2IN75_RHIMU
MLEFWDLPLLNVLLFSLSVEMAMASGSMNLVFFMKFESDHRIGNVCCLGLFNF